MRVSFHTLCLSGLLLVVRRGGRVITTIMRCINHNTCMAHTISVQKSLPPRSRSHKSCNPYPSAHARVSSATQSQTHSGATGWTSQFVQIHCSQSISFMFWGDQGTAPLSPTENAEGLGLATEPPFGVDGTALSPSKERLLSVDRERSSFNFSKGGGFFFAAVAAIALRCVLGLAWAHPHLKWSMSSMSRLERARRFLENNIKEKRSLRNAAEK